MNVPHVPGRARLARALTVCVVLTALAGCGSVGGGLDVSALQTATPAATPAAAATPTATDPSATPTVTAASPTAASPQVPDVTLAPPMQVFVNAPAVIAFRTYVNARVQAVVALDLASKALASAATGHILAVDRQQIAFAKQQGWVLHGGGRWSIIGVTAMTKTVVVISACVVASSSYFTRGAGGPPVVGVSDAWTPAQVKISNVDGRWIAIDVNQKPSISCATAQ